MFCDVRDRAFAQWGYNPLIMEDRDEEIVALLNGIPLALPQYVKAMVLLGSPKKGSFLLTFNQQHDKWEAEGRRWYPDDERPIICPVKAPAK
jgi:hypothetical protein